MRPDQKDLPFFKEFQMFKDYYGDTDYADKFIQAAFGGRKTSFTNPGTNFDFSEYSGDYVALGGKIYTALLAMNSIRGVSDAFSSCCL